MTEMEASPTQFTGDFTFDLVLYDPQLPSASGWPIGFELDHSADRPKRPKHGQRHLYRRWVLTCRKSGGGLGWLPFVPGIGGPGCGLEFDGW